MGHPKKFIHSMYVDNVGMWRVAFWVGRNFRGRLVKREMVENASVPAGCTQIRSGVKFSVHLKAMENFRST